MKKWCECNKHCMVRNPRQKVVHGRWQTYGSRHGCRCEQCVEAYRNYELDRELSYAF